MNRSAIVTNSILWAAAIAASAILHAPSTLTVILLPLLAASSFLLALRPSRTPGSGR